MRGCKITATHHHRIQHSGLLGEDFFAGKALVSREGIAEMDIAKEIFALED